MKYILATITIIVLNISFLLAQNSKQQFHEFNNISFQEQTFTQDNFFTLNKAKMGLSNMDQMIAYREYIDQRNNTHIRYHQYHNKLEVY